MMAIKYDDVSLLSSVSSSNGYLYSVSLTPNSVIFVEFHIDLRMIYNYVYVTFISIDFILSTWATVVAS